jgi:thymidylate synthase (FAD)
MSSVVIVEPKVHLLLSPNDSKDGKKLSAKAARFCTSPDEIEFIMADDTNDLKILERVTGYGHLAVLEMDWWVFGIENVSRTLTHQLVRKRIASYAQESMRYTSQSGVYKIIMPKTLEGKFATVTIPVEMLPSEEIKRHLPKDDNGVLICKSIEIMLSLTDLAELSHEWYEGMQEQGVPNEDARFGLLEASKTKIMVGMNTHALLDFFGERTCSCAQWEIRGVARDMLRLAQEADAIVFKNAGPKCHKTFVCYEPFMKWEKCQHRPHSTTATTEINNLKAKIDELETHLREMLENSQKEG